MVNHTFKYGLCLQQTVMYGHTFHFLLQRDSIKFNNYSWPCHNMHKNCWNLIHQHHWGMGFITKVNFDGESSGKTVDKWTSIYKISTHKWAVHEYELPGSLEQTVILLTSYLLFGCLRTLWSTILDYLAHMSVLELDRICHCGFLYSLGCRGKKNVWKSWCNFIWNENDLCSTFKLQDNFLQLWTFFG